MYFKVLGLHPFRVFLLQFCIVLCFSVSDNVAVTAHARALAIKALSCASSYRMIQMLYFTVTGKQDSSREKWVSLTSNLQYCGCVTQG